MKINKENVLGYLVYNHDYLNNKRLSKHNTYLIIFDADTKLLLATGLRKDILEKIDVDFANEAIVENVVYEKD